MLSIDALPKLTKVTPPRNANAHVLPSHPARVLFNGATRSGKSNLIVTMLTKPAFYKNFFKHVFIISPNFSRDDTFRHIEKLMDDKAKKLKRGIKDSSTMFHVFEQYDPGEMHAVMMELSEATEKLPAQKRPTVLFVLDDIIEDTRLLNSVFLSTLFTKGRHFNASIWFSTQSYKSTPRKMRLQLSDLIVFEPRNDSERHMIYEEWSSSLSEKEFGEMMNLVYSKPFQFLVIRPGSDKKTRFSKNFEFWIVPEKFDDVKPAPVPVRINSNYLNVSTETEIFADLPLRDKKNTDKAKELKEKPFMELTIEELRARRKKV